MKKEDLSKKDKAKVKQFQKDLSILKKEIGKAVIDQQDIINGCLRALLCDGHVIIEGLPGVAKTLAVKTIAHVTGCQSNRIQFTVDLLPADILGITAYNEKKGFYTVKGPIFSNFVIADEINRAPPKTQSALLEAMQEKQVTISKQTFQLEPPFFVMATINPLESGGVYPLPEAQLDRFLFKLIMPYPKMEAEQKILQNNMTLQKFEDFGLQAKINNKKIIEMQKFVKNRIFVGDKIQKYILRIIDATRHPQEYGLKTAALIEYGGSPRASIALFIASKADALIEGKTFVVPQNVKNVAHDILRHRILLNYEAQAEGITPDEAIDEILSKVPVP